MSDQTPVVEGKSRKVSRREAAQTLLSGLAAGVVFPGLSPLHPVRALLLNGPLLDAIDDRAVASETHKPLFLSPAQFSALDKITEAIVPGSRKAHSAAFIDLLLSVDSETSRQEFSAALTALDKGAEKAFQKDVVGLNDAQLNELLGAAASRDSTSFARFESLKGWAVGAYYSSEIGMRELGWTPDRVFSSYPACTNVESHS